MQILQSHNIIHNSYVEVFIKKRKHFSYVLIMLNEKFQTCLYN